MSVMSCLWEKNGKSPTEYCRFSFMVLEFFLNDIKLFIYFSLDSADNSKLGSSTVMNEISYSISWSSDIYFFILSNGCLFQNNNQLLDIYPFHNRIKIIHIPDEQNISHDSVQLPIPTFNQLPNAFYPFCKWVKISRSSSSLVVNLIALSSTVTIGARRSLSYFCLINIILLCDHTRTNPSES